MLKSNGFNFGPNALLSLPTYDLFEELVRIFELNSKPDPYLQFLLDAVLSVSAKKFQGLSEILEWWEKKKEKLSIGRLKNAILMGEGSYWVISELVGIHLGLWFEKEVPTDSALELFEDFKFSVANSLKNYYTKIW